MKIYLAALGWVPDAPAGNRLRWHYPVDTVAGDRYLGLPETIIVERAWLDEDLPQKDEHREPAPPSWWKHMGDIGLAGHLLQVFSLPWPAQAVRFVYMGSDTRLRAFNREDRLVADRTVVNGQTVSLQAPDISALELLAHNVTLQDFAALDLFRDRGLKWEEIARIQVAKTIGLTLDQASLRYDLPSTLSIQEWADLVDHARKASASDPATDAAASDEPTAWQAFQMMIGVRWEHAVLFGHGFFDGPRTKWPQSDEVNKKLILTSVPPRSVAYRVREAQGRLGPSNAVVCPPRLAAPLAAPGVPMYQNPEVRLTVDTDTDRPKFTATYRLHWTQPDMQALGVEIEEEISASPAASLPSAPLALRYTCRTRQPDDPPGEGLQLRSQDVAFHDVQLRCRSRAVDGWDRTSAFTSYTPWTPLDLKHEPAPPNLASATWSGGSASLTRQVDDPHYPNWSPDLIVRHDPGARIFVFRRKVGVSGRPAVSRVNVGAPVLVSANRYRSSVAGLTSLTPFDGGYIVAAPFKAMIRQIAGSDIFFEVGDSTLFSAGDAELQQNPLHLDLWDKVAEFSVHTLPETLTFSDPVAGPGETADVLSYHVRVAFLGTRIGPPSNTVQALRLPVAPTKPPPFSVELLGVDFYNRTLVKICFTTPTSGGRYTVWWANGAPPDFAAKAVPGVLRAQTPHSNRYLFDVLAIPLPQTVDRTITIGVQRVTTGEGQSIFETTPVTLPALAP